MPFRSPIRLKIRSALAPTSARALSRSAGNVAAQSRCALCQSCSASSAKRMFETIVAAGLLSSCATPATRRPMEASRARVDFVSAAPGESRDVLFVGFCLRPTLEVSWCKRSLLRTGDCGARAVASFVRRKTVWKEWANVP